jgi:hypothetical protein
MKFTLPFLKKKSASPPQQEEEKAVEQDMEAVSPPKVDWESIGRASLTPPSLTTQSNPADGMATFESFDLPPMRQAEFKAEAQAEAKTFTTLDKSPAAASNSAAAESKSEVIPTPVKVTPQVSAPAPIAAKLAPQLEAKPNSQPEAKPESQTVTPQPVSQLSTQPATQSATQPILRMTKEDVIAAYKIFLNRLPESTKVIDLRTGGTVEAHLIDFVLSNEFLKRAEVKPMILELAKHLTERQKAATVPTGSPAAGKSA